MKLRSLSGTRVCAFSIANQADVPHPAQSKIDENLKRQAERAAASESDQREKLLMFGGPVLLFIALWVYMHWRRKSSVRN